MNSASPGTETFLAILCWVGVVVGAIGLYFALWGDRARGRKRCPKCWYDMAGLGSLRCPECGNLAQDEAKLVRTRRRWRWAVIAAVMLCAGLGFRSSQIVRKRGWMGLVPTSVVILLPYHEDSLIGASDEPVFLKGKGWITTSLRTRIMEDELWGWQNAVVCWRIEGRLKKRSLLSPDGGRSELYEKLNATYVPFEGNRTTAGELIDRIEMAAGIGIRFDEASLGPIAGFRESPVGVRPWRSALEALDDGFGPVVVAAPWVQAQWYHVDGGVFISERGKPQTVNDDSRRWVRHDLANLVDRTLAMAEATQPLRPQPTARSFPARPAFSTFQRPLSSRAEVRNELRQELLLLAYYRPIRAEWIGDELFVCGDPIELCRARFAIERLRRERDEGSAGLLR